MKFKNKFGECPLKRGLVKFWIGDGTIIKLLYNSFSWKNNIVNNVVYFEPLNIAEHPLDFDDIPWKDDFKEKYKDQESNSNLQEETNLQKGKPNLSKEKTAQDFLSQAKSLMDERGKQYDQENGERSASKVAKAFNSITGKDISASEIWLILLILKQVRQWNTKSFHKDSAEDSVAYAALLSEELSNE